MDDFYCGSEEQSMDVKLNKVLDVGDKFKYRYDFGDTTELEGKVVDSFIYYTQDKQIEIMARHNNPNYKCSECDNDAEYFSYESGRLCEVCAEGEEDYLNELGDYSSPRDGICAYVSEREDEEPYLPQMT